MYKLPEFLRFLIAGGVAALVNLASRYLFNFFTVFEAAAALAYLCGMFTAYLLMRATVFAASGRSKTSEVSRFVLVNAVGIIQVVGVSALFYRLIFPALGMDFYPAECAHFIGVVSSALTSYWGHKHFSFRRDRR